MFSVGVLRRVLPYGINHLYHIKHLNYRDSFSALSLFFFDMLDIIDGRPFSIRLVSTAPMIETPITVTTPTITRATIILSSPYHLTRALVHLQL